jgi:hypothetical protein
MRIRVLVASIAIGAAVLTACSDDDPEATPAPTGPQFTGIDDVLRADGATLVVESDVLPTADGTGLCQAEVTPSATETADEVVVYIGYESATSPPFDGCELATRTVTVTLAAPVGARRVIDAMGARFWQEGGEWIGCGHVVMTCVPGPATCDNLPDSVANLDVPQGTGVDVHGCDGRFAVVDADMGRRDCPAGGECRRVDRLFLAVQDEEWAVVGRGRAAGCDVIADHAPDFPTAMCEGLPAP